MLGGVDSDTFAVGDVLDEAIVGDVAVSNGYGASTREKSACGFVEESVGFVHFEDADLWDFDMSDMLEVVYQIFG